MGRLLLSFSLLFLFSCSRDQNSSSSERSEELVGLSVRSECGRVREIFGSNYLYQWVKAEEGDLQKMIISSDTKNIHYVEARREEDLRGTSSYRFLKDSFFFNTTTKSLKFTFPDMPRGSIEEDEGRKEYKVGILNYKDGSGTRAFFLCGMK